MSVADAGDYFLMLFMEFDEVVDHGFVAFVDECSFDGGEFFSDFFDVGIEVLLVGFEFLFDAFFADEKPGEPGDEEFEFFGEWHGFPHADEEGLCVGVDEGDGELV